MILGHLTNTILIRDLSERHFQTPISLTPLVLGAFLPDLLDKPIHLITGLPSRGLFHSFLLLTLFLLIPSRIWPSRKQFFRLFWFGGLLHLLQDLAPLKTIFWPFLGMWDPPMAHTFWDSFVHLYLHQQPFGLWLMEIIGLAYCLGVLFHRRLRGIEIPRPSYPLRVSIDPEG